VLKSLGTLSIHSQTAYGKRGVRTTQYKLILTQNRKSDPMKTILFDLKNDPYELKNVAGENPEVVKQLTRDELIPWLRKNGDPWLKRIGK
jgi:arylsulfatase A-like enzyme